LCKGTSTVILAFSEKYRDDLRAREETIRSLRESVALYEIEAGKWAKEHDRYEEHIQQLEKELSVALEAHTHLDEQKQENMLLKETIDRMRFDMDEMRSNMGNLNPGGNSGQSSNANTISKSLGAELMGQWPMSPAEGQDQDDVDSEDSTVIEEEETTEVDDEDEDVIQTIITKRKRVRFVPIMFVVFDINPSPSCRKSPVVLKNGNQQGERLRN